MRRISGSEAPGVSCRTVCRSTIRTEGACHRVVRPMAAISRGRAVSASWKPRAREEEAPSPYRNRRRAATSTCPYPASRTAACTLAGFTGTAVSATSGTRTTELTREPGGPAVAASTQRLRRAVPRRHGARGAQVQRWPSHGPPRFDVGPGSGWCWPRCSSDAPARRGPRRVRRSVTRSQGRSAGRRSNSCEVMTKGRGAARPPGRRGSNEVTTVDARPGRLRATSTREEPTCPFPPP